MTRRLLISYLLLTAFVLAVVELPLGLTYAGRQEDRLLADVERDARVLAGLVEERVESDDPAAVTAITERYAEQTEGRVVVTDEQGIAIVDTARPADAGRNFSTRPEFRTALDGTQAVGHPDLADPGRGARLRGRAHLVGVRRERRRPGELPDRHAAQAGAGQLAAPGPAVRPGAVGGGVARLAGVAVGDRARGGPRRRGPTVGRRRPLGPCPGGPRTTGDAAPGRVLQRHGRPAGGADRLAAGLRGRRVPPAPHPAHRAPAAAGRAGGTGGRRRRGVGPTGGRRHLGRGRTARPAGGGTAGPGPGRSRCRGDHTHTGRRLRGGARRGGPLGGAGRRAGRGDRPGRRRQRPGPCRGRRPGAGARQPPGQRHRGRSRAHVDRPLRVHARLRGAGPRARPRTGHVRRRPGACHRTGSGALPTPRPGGPAWDWPSWRSWCGPPAGRSRWTPPPRAPAWSWTSACHKA